MKKLLTFGVLMVMAIAASAEPQEKTHEFRATTVQKKKVVKTEKAPVVTRNDVGGALPRALRGGNPLQMFNPKAPAKYGTADQSVAYNPISGKYDQIKLFEIYW
jgi:hypothetical protein